MRPLLQGAYAKVCSAQGPLLQGTYAKPLTLRCLLQGIYSRVPALRCLIKEYLYQGAYSELLAPRLPTLSYLLQGVYSEELTPRLSNPRLPTLRILRPGANRHQVYAKDTESTSRTPSLRPGHRVCAEEQDYRAFAQEPTDLGHLVYA